MANGVVIASVGERMDYDIAIASLKSQGLEIKDGNNSQSFLRLECIVDPGLSEFAFPVLVNTQNQGEVVWPTAKQLKLQDAFYCTKMAYWIEAFDLGTAEPIRDLLRYVPFTYPSEALNRSGMVLSKLGYKLWSGYVKLNVNGTDILPAWDLNRHLSVPQSQVEAVNGPFPVSEFYTDHDEFYGSSLPFYPMEPNTVFIGNDGITLTVKFPEAIGNAIPALSTGKRVKMVLFIRGILAQNCSKNA